MKMFWHPCTGGNHTWANLAPRAAFADGPVADTAEPLTTEAGVVGAEPDRDDGDTVTHG